MKAPTLADVRRMMLRRNPDAAPLTVRWIRRPRLVTSPTGWRGYLGTVELQAPGYRTSLMVVERDAEGTMVR